MTTARTTLSKIPSLLWISIGLYVALFVLLTTWKLNHFYYDNLDLAIFNQVFFNTIRGSFFTATIHPPSYLGDHFSPLILLLAPLYAMAPGPQFLLVLETLIIGLTAIPVFLIAQQTLATKKIWLPLGIAFLWLVNPSVHNMNFFEFELMPFAVFFLFWMYYGYVIRNPYVYVTAALLALTAREDTALVILCFGIMAWVQKRNGVWRTFPLIAGIVWLALSFLVIGQFAPQHSYKFLIYYGWLGGTTLLTVVLSFLAHPLKLLQNFVTYTNLEMVLGLTFPFLFLVFRRSAAWLLLLAPAAQIFLGEGGGGALIFMTHHSGFFLFGLFIIFIEAVAGLESGAVPRLLRALRSVPAIYCITAAATMYAAVTYGSIVPAVRAWSFPRQEISKKTIVESIPPDVAVAATYELLTPLSGRDRIYGLNYAFMSVNQFGLSSYELPADTEYLALDWEDVLKNYIHISSHPRYEELAPSFASHIRSILSEFRIVSAHGSVMLLKRGTEGMAPSELLSVTDSVASDTASEPALVSVRAQSGLIMLDIAVPAHRETSAGYYLTVATRAQSFNLPLGYFLDEDLRVAHTLTMPLFLPPAELQGLSVTLYRWDHGFLKLGELKNLSLVTDSKELGTLP